MVNERLEDEANLACFWTECAAVYKNRSALEKTAVHEKLLAKLNFPLSLEEVYSFYESEVDQLQAA